MADLLKNLAERAAKTGSQAVGNLLGDPKRAAQVAQVVGALESGKEALEGAQAQVLHAMGFAHRSDYVAIDKQLSQVRRQARRLLVKLQKLEG